MNTEPQIAHDSLLQVSKYHNRELYRIIERNGPIEVGANQSHSLHTFLGKTIVGQQLSSAASSTIWGRVERLGKEHQLSMTQLFSGRYIDDIHRCGVSRSKIKALLCLSNAFERGDISDNIVKDLDYDGVVLKVTSIWGLGAWSADMVAIFYSGLEDVWSKNDAALNRGIKMLSNNCQSGAEFSSRYSPYRSVLARHIWKSLDDGTLQTSDKRR